MRIPSACVHCSGQYLEHIGFGTERVEHEIAERFPDARVARVDRDTIRRRGAIGALLRRFSAGEIDVLVGTQMIAKGHDFPQVTLVGVISADVGLGLADFRAAERTFQLLTQVAGRAGRGEIAGRSDRADAFIPGTTASGTRAARITARSTRTRSATASRCAIRR